MTYRNEVRYTSERAYDGSQATRYMPNYTPPSLGNSHGPSGHLPRRRRWAAGYIDRQSCPSNGYINTHSYAPDDDYPSDTEYIANFQTRSDEYIQPRHHHDSHAPRHAKPRRSTKRPETSTEKRSTSPSPSSTSDSTPPGSDIERHRTRSRSPSPRPKTSHNHNKSHHPSPSPTPRQRQRRRPSGSDIASLAPSSPSPSDYNSLSSSSLASDMQRLHHRHRRSTTRSASPSESGYISLDEYIAGRSDVVSVREGEESEGGGEGSDGEGSEDEVRSEVGEGSDGFWGSDVEVLPEWGDQGGGDFIEEGWGGEGIERGEDGGVGSYRYDGYRRYRGR